jgi:hypothetical protein
MRIEYIGLKPDRGQSPRRDGEVVGQPAHRGCQAACSSGISGPASMYVVLG